MGVAMDERTHVAVYVHLVWGTWDRLPLLNRDLENDVHRVLAAECLALRCDVVTVGGIADHVHLLVRLSPTVSIADLVKQLKGSSTHLVTHKFVPGGFFKWQAGYGAVTVSPRHLDQASNYISRQREHHAANTLLASLEPPARPIPPKQS